MDLGFIVLRAQHSAKQKAVSLVACAEPFRLASRSVVQFRCSRGTVMDPHAASLVSSWHHQGSRSM